MQDSSSELRSIWSEVLRQEDSLAAEITDESDLFASGGTSITAVYMAARIQERLGVEVDAIEVVTHPTFGALAALVGERRRAPAAVPLDPA